MRTLLFVLLLGVAVTAALLWNRKTFAPVEVGPLPQGGAQGAPPLPVDQVVLVLGLPPGRQGEAEGRRPERRERLLPPPARPSRPRPGPSASPRRRPSPSRGRPPSPPAPAASLRIARLKKGETVYGLAQRLLGDGRRYGEILKLNGLDEAQARRLRPGTVLRIPPR